MNAQQFIDALRAVEERGDLEPMVKLYADDATLWSPELCRPLGGPHAPRNFWKSYRDTFVTICSRFLTQIEGPNQAALEWESDGTLRLEHHPFSYRGVSVVEWSDRGICRFAAYFDPAKLRVSEPPKQMTR